VKLPLRGSIGAVIVKRFLNARFPVVELRSNREPVNAPGAVSFLRITWPVEKCIDGVPNVRRSRDCLSSSVVPVTTGLIAQPVERKFLQTQS
jgi:hypothetical protein